MGMLAGATTERRDRPGANLGPTVANFVLVGLSLTLALFTNLFLWPDSNFALSLMIPVLIGMLRASPTGMRVIVAVVIASDVVITVQSHMSVATWAMTVSTIVAVCFLALRIHSQRLEILGLQRTATERAERAERHEEQLVDFIDLVYHDVRLPLEAARIQLKALRKGPRAKEPDWVQARSEDADAALGHMSAMLKDLFDIGRQEAGRLSPRRVTIDLKGFLVALLDRLAAAIDVERVGVEVPAGVVVEADHYQLERIVGNLVANALKYSEAKTKVTVRVEERGDEVVLSVTDRGIGIAAEDLPFLFQRGYRTAEARNRADGAGLGLYAVRLFVEAHGGRIWVESTPGDGSTFHVALPGDGHGNREVSVSSRVPARNQVGASAL